MNDKPFVFVIIWWLFWQLVNFFEVTDIKAASLITNFIFLLMYVSMVLGYLLVKTTFRPHLDNAWGKCDFSVSEKFFSSERVNYIYLIVSIVILVFGLYKSQAFSLSFTEYFLKMRGVDALGVVTGISALDNFIKIFIVPIVIASTVYVMSGIRSTNKISWVKTIWSLINVLLFSYLFQVNYILLLTLFLFMFYIIDSQLESIYRSWVLKLVFFIIFILVSMSAINRYGSFDIAAIILYYPATYFSLSFSLFDYNLSNETILHEYTYGLSSFGYFSVLPFMLFKAAGLLDYIYMPIVMENITHNNECVFLGGSKCYNAFGSVAFSLYRDLGVFGVAVGGFFYGVTIGYLNIKKHKSVIAEMIYFYLLAMGIIGIMVSPFDLPYFWFVFIFIFIYSLKIKTLKTSSPPSKIMKS